MSLKKTLTMSQAHKLKKDPRVDGLPDSGEDILIWTTLRDAPSIGYYNSIDGEGLWLPNSPMRAALSIERIKFWCYTKDIE